MIERLNRYRQQLLAVLIAEVAVAFVCYMMLHDHAFLIFSIIIAIANGLVGYAVFRNLAELEKMAVDVRDVIGPETSNTFLFGQVGMLMYDENHTIYFQSELFDERDMYIRGMSLKEWQPKLEENFNSQDIIDIECGEWRFEVYNNQDTKTLYLKDVTYFKELLETYNSELKLPENYTNAKIKLLVDKEEKFNFSIIYTAIITAAIFTLIYYFIIAYIIL